MLYTEIKISLECDHCKKIYKLLKWRKVAHDKEGRKRHFCSRDCLNKHQKGKTNFAFKGGMTVNKGYKRLSFGQNKGKYLHVLIMEKHINRKLKSKETIHHLNGDRSDNRLENLCLCKNNHEHISKFHTAKQHQGFMEANICSR